MCLRRCLFESTSFCAVRSLGLRMGVPYKRKAVIPMEALRLSLRLPLPFAGITQTGSQGLPILLRWRLSARTSSPSISRILIHKDSDDVNPSLFLHPTGVGSFSVLPTSKAKLISHMAHLPCAFFSHGFGIISSSCSPGATN
jgi:hypothetical protein